MGLGAFGHVSAVRNVHAAIDHYPIDGAIRETLYIVWYFVSGCMLLFGCLIVWIWFRLRVKDTSALFVAFLIGFLYVATGAGGLIYRHGDPFWLFFILLGILLLVSAYGVGAGHWLETRHAEGGRAPGSSTS